MVEDHPAPLRRFRVTITCPSFGWREAVVVQAADPGEAQPAAIAVCNLPLNGELIDFDVHGIDGCLGESA